ncbi:MAG: acyl-CoA dehydrogenase family protein [candidate division KSB1 bacterium]|nr:acyl-CoA dehydrogenase family protein [candidate division KSB1 bacterium]MDZ7302162.1 acyl-CoA dehydrogenase family protein [candidate division KSB1 bacterium]MDZ7311271.1 acyl-CoA dehydrogenase family protein [candidate division KSB1 bacterium]
MADLNPIDFYNTEALFSAEEKAVRDQVREFVRKEAVPIIRDHFRAGTFPQELIKPIGEMGLLGANLHGYECPGLNNVAYGLIMQELEWCDSALRSLASVQGGLVMYPIWAFGSEEQKNKYLPKLARAEIIGCFGLTEPDFGSNPAGMATHAYKTANGYVLNGRKMWITNGTLAEIAVVWAKLDGHVRGFIVEKGTKGFAAKAMHGKLSLRASDTAELLLDDCFVPENAILPKSDGIKSPLSCLTQARYGIAWGVLGAARACYEEALRYAQNRIQFDKPIAAFQLTQEKFAHMVSEITKMQLLCLQLGRMKDEGTIHPAQVSLAKRNNCHHALEIARMCREILGANGIIDDYVCMRHAVNLESVKTYEGTHEIHTLILGQAVTGIAAFE